MPPDWTAIGLMSGTSGDGIDAVCVRTDGEMRYTFLGSVHVPYAADFSRRLLGAARDDVGLSDLMALERELTEQHVAAVARLLDGLDTSRPTAMGVIGFHGHTVRHDPSRGLTWQLGDAAWLAERTGWDVVSDFRRRDMAAGGQGAPLTPLFHQRICQAESSRHPLPALVLNLGGVANVTYIGEDNTLVSGDTGPGCGLLDDWVRQTTALPFDVDGRLAAAGSVDQGLVEAALQHPFFARPMPKSLDRFDLHVDLGERSAADGAATLCALTVQAIGLAASRFSEAPRRVWVSGGGSRHPVIMRMLGDQFRHVENISAIGGRADDLEAECFAWLAVRHLRGLPTSLPSTTGCRWPTCGGTLTGRVAGA